MSPTLMRLFICLLLVALYAPASFSAAQSSSHKTSISFDTLIPPVPAIPLSEWRDTPGRKAVSLQVDKAELRGFRYTGTNPRAPELLFFNGLGMSVSHADRLYRSLAAAGPTVNVYDYRGWAFSGGSSSMSAFRSDALRLYDTLSHNGNRKIVVYGASMGTAVATFVASQRHVSAVVLGMPIASADEELPIFGQLIGFSAEQLANVEPSDEFRDALGETVLIAQSSAPLLVLGGERDRVVPVKQAQEVFAASPASNKKIVVVPGADHNDVIVAPAAMSAVSTFLQQL